MPVLLLTDFGPGTGYVGALHVVLATRCPGVERIDLAHDVPPGDVAAGAALLAEFVAMAPGGVFLAVVDPGVGTARRPIAVALADGGTLVGPDNGLLHTAATAAGIAGAVELASPVHRRTPASATFHGRDVFAPAAAHLARGGALGDLGPAVPADGLVAAPASRVVAGDGALEAGVLGHDRFGNVQLAATAADLDAAGLRAGATVTVTCDGGRLHAVVASTFGDVPAGGGAVIVDSHGRVAVVRNGAHAHAALGHPPAGRPVRIARTGASGVG